MNILSTLLLTAALALASPVAASSNEEKTSNNGEETRSLDELYAAAVAEEGNLVYYAGGDIAAQQTSTHDDFVKAFPKINFTIVTDYSKFHDDRIDNQLATNSLDVDVASLQTLQNFPRWEKEGNSWPTILPGSLKLTPPSSRAPARGCRLGRLPSAWSRSCSVEHLQGEVPQDACGLGRSHLQESYRIAIPS
ncbi:hypothetical protein AeNC1_018275 [Aphanomyces euteiches]|nr:hypothetical protein AeNC1_018275 [Aphanomyces euteiches]